MAKGRTKLFITIGATVAAVIATAVFLFPIYSIFVGSLRPYAGLFPLKSGIIPTEVTLKAYMWVLFESKFVHWLRNSLAVSLLTVTFTLIFVVPASYAFSRFRFFGKGKLLYGYLMFTQFAGGMGMAGLIALYAILAYFGLTNDLLILALIYSAGAVPFNTWLLKTYFDTIPKDFDEAALVDGAGFFDLMLDVLLPIAKPGIATVAIFAFMGAWNEFIIAQTILTTENYTLPVGLFLLVAPEGGTSWTQFAAMSLLFAAPVVVMYLVAQRYFQAGLAMGGVKR